MSLILVSSHVLICLFLIIIVLLQQGKGADIGATFGGGSNTIFGASGADNLLSRVTTITAVAFMCTSVLLAIQSKSAAGGGSSKLFQSTPAPLDIPAELPASEEGPAVEGPTASGPTAEEPSAEGPLEVVEETPPAESASSEVTPVAETPPAIEQPVTEQPAQEENVVEATPSP